MVIQDTQVPMYTIYTLFLYFSDFSKKNLYEKQNKEKLKNNETKTDNHMKAERKMHMHEGMIENADVWKHDFKSRWETKQRVLL